MAKLVEEAHEADGAPAADLPGELADVLEVLGALIRALGMTWEELLSMTARKRGERGGFDGRVFLDYIDSPAQH